MYTGLPKGSPRGQSWGGQWPLLLLNISNMRVGFAYMPCCFLNVRVQTTVYYKNPKFILCMYCWDKEAETVWDALGVKVCWGGRPICSGRPVGSFRFPCHPRWATEPKIEASPINEDASLSAYLPRCMGDTSTQYATVINKKLCELCYMSAISSGKFQWIYRALLNLLLHAFNPTEAFSIWRATSIDILLSKYIWTKY